MPLAQQPDEHSQFRDHKREARVFTTRVVVAFLLVLALFGVLVGRFYSLQIVHFEDYATRADSNRIQVQPAPPTRGLIYDRNGNLLVDNRPSFTLTVVKERTENLEATLNKIAGLIHVDDEDRKNFYRALRQRRRPFEPVPLRYRLNEDEIARIAVNEYQLDGVEVEAQLVRHYPYGPLFAHTIGYVGQISERELGSFDEEEYRRYNGTRTIGKIGLERYYESELLGEVGSEQVEVNAHGRVLRVLDRLDPAPGADLHLHMDLNVQLAGAQALEGQRGAVVAIDIATGGVIAQVSAPSFDANLFVTGISFDKYRELNESRDLPLYNRAIQGQYPPASTLKPMLGLGALHFGVVTPEFTIRDPGFYQLENDSRRYRDWKRWGHGNQVDLHQAIVESCDVYFYDLAFKMGIDRMHPVGVEFGLGEPTGIDIPNERGGLWPSRVWKKGARGLPWFPGDSLNVSIGQGDVLTTPLQLAVMAATLGSRGTHRRPQIVAQVGIKPLPPEVLHAFHVAPKHWDYVDKAMKGVVHEASGTAKVIAPGLKFTIAGKTGTAQVVGIAQDEEYDRDKVYERNRDHALFVAYAPAEAPEIAVAVIVENGEHGSSAAAPVARQVMDAWFHRSGAPLPAVGAKANRADQLTNREP